MGNDGSLVRYGQSVMFTLKPMIGLTESNAEDPPEQPLYLASDLEHLCDPVCQPGIQPLYFEYAKPSFAAQWRIEAADPKLRLEFEGRPVRLDEKVIIKHVRTNKSLALEPNCQIRNVFGRDLNVSANTYYDSHKAERDVNIWTLTSARQPGVPGDNRIANRAALPATADNTSWECDVAHHTPCGHQAA
ncbi:uncharacterized protein DEA37_0005180 [Paragonimus westermani]|uniref:Uncharacterized protein n=1 Tax=Paragonimus westermani TaxID=34504 RepID=A0A5J4N7D7_9TREM|nr:uncharacterized protein DEA37_0005180 [Paragonimus westermani]